MDESLTSSAVKAARILVVDDEQGMRDLLSRELSSAGHDVAAAAGGEDALQKSARQKFNLALCDIHMPGMGGLELLAKLKAQDPEIEVIIITGNATIESAVRAMKQGAYDYLQKPFNLDELHALVAKSLEKSGLRTLVQELRDAKKELEEAQRQLVQSEKLAGIGQLAAGVAHELNNPLSGVLGFSQLLLEDPALSPQQRQDLETIHTQSQRCRTIIQNLLQFCRRKDPKKEPLNLLALLENTLQLIHYDFSTSGIEIVQDFPVSFPLVLGDASQIQQVFLNLITNARQAMEGSPTKKISIQASHGGGRVVMRFKDSGGGMASEIIGKIFDPFFTTKPIGKGTGLGLSICYGIIQEHQGSLTAESRPGEGATFTLELPVYEP